MHTAPLLRVVVEVRGAPFLALVTPEDGVVRASGFATPDDPVATQLASRLASLDPTLGARGVAREATHTGDVATALRAYAGGNLTALDSLPVSQPSTPFRREVWRALREVPAGRVVSYTELAARAGRPAAVRAAASACAANLLALIVPCHRVVRSDGTLGGYLFGTELKQQLLEHEGADYTRR